VKSKEIERKYKHSKKYFLPTEDALDKSQSQALSVYPSSNSRAALTEALRHTA
jgi:hypothetical protein